MKLAHFIDHTLLKADATETEIARLCAEAVEHGFCSVCVNGVWVEKAARLLAGTDVRVAAVTGFPLGAMASESKVNETAIAMRNGASEIDTVINIGKLKSGDANFVRTELRNIVEAAEGGTVKAILETCLLTEEEIIQACHLAVEAGVRFVKTSTGFNARGATLAVVRLMKRTVGNRCEVKASGGIRDLSTALAFINAGATRIGTSSGVAITKEEDAAL